MRPDFSDLKIDAVDNQITTQTETQDFGVDSEGMPMKKHLSEEDIYDAEHLNFAAGFPPFTRGIFSTMYITNPLKTGKYNSGTEIKNNFSKEEQTSFVLELAYTLAKGKEHINDKLELGIKIDEIASEIYFSCKVSNNFFMEIAKLRAARMIWAKIVNQFNPKKQESMMMHVHSETSKLDSKEKDYLDNITRTSIEAISAVFSGTESLDTPHNIVQHIEDETNITKAIDPWAGSYYIEFLTKQIANNTWTIISEIENIGGVAKALKSRLHKINY